MLLSHLLYVSEARKPMSDPELHVLLQRCRPNNQLRNVTGLLLYSGGHFIQLLEGREPALAVLFEKIAQDPRHQNVQKLYFQRTGRRIFPEWQMGLLNLDTAVALDRPKLQAMVEQVKQRDTGTAGATAGAELIAVLREFRRQLPAGANASPPPTAPRKAG